MDLWRRFLAWLGFGNDDVDWESILGKLGGRSRTRAEAHKHREEDFQAFINLLVKELKKEKMVRHLLSQKTSRDDLSHQKVTILGAVNAGKSTMVAALLNIPESDDDFPRISKRVCTQEIKVYEKFSISGNGKRAKVVDNPGFGDKNPGAINGGFFESLAQCHKALLCYNGALSQDLFETAICCNLLGVEVAFVCTKCDNDDDDTVDPAEDIAEFEEYLKPFSDLQELGSLRESKFFSVAARTILRRGDGPRFDWEVLKAWILGTTVPIIDGEDDSEAEPGASEGDFEVEIDEGGGEEGDDTGEEVEAAEEVEAEAVYVRILFPADHATQLHQPVESELSSVRVDGRLPGASGPSQAHHHCAAPANVAAMTTSSKVGLFHWQNTESDEAEDSEADDNGENFDEEVGRDGPAFTAITMTGSNI